MRLTGKAEKDFVEWYRVADFKSNYKPGLALFYNYPESMQYGVFVDFFDTKGILISVAGLKLSKTYIFDKLNNSMKYGVYLDFFYSVEIMTELQTESIKKANEIYNLK